MNVVITGVSSGIGLELLKMSMDREHRVLAVARRPEASSEVMALKSNPCFSLLKLDLEEKGAEKKIAEAARDWGHIDLVINNAGVYLEDKTREDFEKTFLTNAIMPLLITRSLIPLLKNSQRPISLQITSQMGSIADNASGGSYSYRASKAALNMLFKSLSVDEKWLTSLLVHPGWVKTRMGGAAAPVSVHDSATGIWKIIESAGPEMSGSFINYRGEKLPW